MAASQSSLVIVIQSKKSTMPIGDMQVRNKDRNKDDTHPNRTKMTPILKFVFPLFFTNFKLV